MAVRDELEDALRAIRDERPGALQAYPGLGGETDRRPPFAVWLAPWATGVAADLHARFGADVELQVGALRYPQAELASPLAAALDVPDVDPDEAQASLDGPLTVRSGSTARHRLLVRNPSGTGLRLATNGGLTAFVVDPRTGEVAGGYAGAQALPLVTFDVGPGGTAIPLLVGTASFLPRLGYAIPPGDWAIRAPLDLGGGRRARTPLLPLTVTA